MKLVNIWHIAENTEFPVEMGKYNMFDLDIKTFKLDQLSSAQFDPATINIVLINISFNQWNENKKEIIAKLNDEVISQNLIITDKLEDLFIPVNGKYFAMGNPLHKHELKMILEKTIIAAYYKMALKEISENSLNNFGFFESVIELAGKETKNAKEESWAYLRLLEYESQMKSFQNSLNKAFENLLELKDSELGDMKKIIEASQKLDQLREIELKNALNSRDAVEKVLLFTRKEEMDLEKIIEAQNNLFEYTNEQIKQLVEENRRLKKIISEK